ncbi:MAG: GreA/GreB family elongation factor [Myxococcota bacterium]|nr:GreA/GreB family elongation factor [Myxococcota bacterium]
MSKAFVNEDAATVEPSARAGRRPGAEQRYITPGGHRRLVDALEQVRAALSALPTSADPASRADLEAKIVVGVEVLDSVTVVHTPPATHAAFFGAWVELEDEDGERVRYRLVGPDEVDVRAGWISVESPIGQALLGRTVGDEVTVHRPRGAREYLLVAIRAEPPDAPAELPAR